uniref:Secreted protein n=1 Tax=Pristhesancus plagipennis TaxID=1955184 RepID=A0A2K8JWK5_PRIPG|nr:secreted hypothetical protein [Pristhesancus plagipennis]
MSSCHCFVPLMPWFVLAHLLLFRTLTLHVLSHEVISKLYPLRFERPEQKTPLVFPPTAALSNEQRFFVPFSMAVLSQAKFCANR